MAGLVKLLCACIGVTFLIADMTEVVPAWAQLLAYSLIIAGWIARKDD